VTYPCAVSRKHQTKTTFILCVDAFSVKYFTKGEADHLIVTITLKYECMADREGNLYCDLNLKWKYKEGCDDVSMQNYVRVAINNIIFFNFMLFVNFYSNTCCTESTSILNACMAGANLRATKSTIVNENKKKTNSQLKEIKRI